MMEICATALCIGFLAAFVLSIVPFAGGLTVSVVIGTGLSVGVGRSIGDTALIALGILVACQVGYGLGLVAAALGDRLWHTSRRWRQPNDVGAIKRLRSGRK